MDLYFSSTPRNDAYQDMENGMCKSRLFSLHGDYKKAVFRWAKELPLSDIHPRKIMLDSGAFTAWNKGHVTKIEEVIAAYETFMDLAGDAFDEVWMINLDKIPGERGRDPTQEELVDAVRTSDINFEILEKRFGHRILPVFHQGEDTGRLYDVEQQAEYICVSPRNDMGESLRVQWSINVHSHIKGREGYSGHKTHGLATTGNKMMQNVPWSSVDSAAWVLQGAYGKCLVNMGNKFISCVFSYESDKFKTWDHHYDTLPDIYKEKILERLAAADITLDDVKFSSRLRNIFSMYEMQHFVDSMEVKDAHTLTLFGV